MRVFGYENEGIMASELVSQLQKLIDDAGDGVVVLNGNEYPDLCKRAYIQKSSDAYLITGAITIS